MKTKGRMKRGESKCIFTCRRTDEIKHRYKLFVSSQSLKLESKGTKTYLFNCTLSFMTYLSNWLFISSWLRSKGKVTVSQRTGSSDKLIKRNISISNIIAQTNVSSIISRASAIGWNAVSSSSIILWTVVAWTVPIKISSWGVFGWIIVSTCNLVSSRKVVSLTTGCGSSSASSNWNGGSTFSGFQIDI